MTPVNYISIKLICYRLKFQYKEIGLQKINSTLSMSLMLNSW